MKRIYLSPPQMDGREKEILSEALDSNWITTLGPQVDAFERELSQKIGVPNSVALSSGTAALHLSLVVLGVRTGDRVITSDLTFAATANAIAYCDAHPVFVDSSADTWNMDPELLRETLKACERKGNLPKAVMAVDLYGQSADYRLISQVCSEYSVPLVEDAAEALGTTYEGKAAGSFGCMGIVSFNGNKIITTSGGGMLLSDNEDYIKRARHLATQARDPFPYYHHTSIGYNYRLSNLLAAIGRAQLETIDHKVQRRREINAFYREALGDVPGIQFMPEAPYGKSNCWLTCVTIDPSKFRASNEDIRLFLETHNIESRHVWKPMHMQPVFAGCEMFGGSVSEDLFARGLCLPSGSSLFKSDLERVCGLIRQFQKDHSPS